MAKMTDEAMAKLTASLTAGIDENSPFFTQDGQTYMRHDELRIRATGKDTLSVEFFWRGMHTYTMDIHCDLMAGQLAIMTGVEGRMGVSVR